MSRLADLAREVRDARREYRSAMARVLQVSITDMAVKHPEEHVWRALQRVSTAEYTMERALAEFTGKTTTETEAAMLEALEVLLGKGIGTVGVSVSVLRIPLGDTNA